MSLSTITAFAPATVANLACGFDVLGLALESLGDKVILSKNSLGKVIIKDITGDNKKLPRETSKNTSGVVVEMYLKHYGIKEGVDIILHKNLPLGSGLGGSSSSAVAAVYAANEMFRCAKNKIELLPFAIEAEKTACGIAHGDNVAPSLLGGLCYVRNCFELDVFQIPYPDFLLCVVITPDYEINTKDSRAILPQKIEFEKAKKQWANLGGAIHAFHTKNKELLKKCLQDEIVEPYRRHLIPYYQEVKKISLNGGAIACNISGSGPTIFCLVDSMQIANNIQNQVQEVYNNKGMNCKIFISKINDQGAKIIKS